MLLRKYRDPGDREKLRKGCRDSFYGFVRMMFEDARGYEWASNHHHKEICRALLRVYEGKCKRLIINVPPRYSKTEMAVINFIAWTLGHNPDAEFIHVSYAASLATANAHRTREMVQSEFYRHVFPDLRLATDSKAKGDWKTTAGGAVYATGSGGTITGFGAGKMRAGFGGAIIIDDPHKADEARSETMRRNVIDWFGNTLESRKNSPDTPIILIMQRLHESDLAGFLLAGGNGEEWEHVTFEAIQPDGTALWPAKHDLATLRAMEKANPYVFAGQYMQRPAPLAGGEFKPDTIGTIEALPIGTRFVRAWDLAGTAGDGDFTAGALLGMTPEGQVVIADMVCVQESPEVVEATIKATAQRDGTGVSVYIPQDPGQAGKAQLRSLIRLLAGFSASGKPVTGDKVTRARPLAAQVNIGNVVMLRGGWNQAMVTEMRNFPNGAHDDMVDALSLAFDALTDNRLGLLDFYRAEAQERAQLRAATAAPDTTGFLNL